MQSRDDRRWLPMLQSRDAPTVTAFAVAANLPTCAAAVLVVGSMSMWWWPPAVPSAQIKRQEAGASGKRCRRCEQAQVDSEGRGRGATSEVQHARSIVLRSCFDVVCVALSLPSADLAGDFVRCGAVSSEQWADPSL